MISREDDIDIDARRASGGGAEELTMYSLPSMSFLLMTLQA